MFYVFIFELIHIKCIIKGFIIDWISILSYFYPLLATNIPHFRKKSIEKLLQVVWVYTQATWRRGLFGKVFFARKHCRERVIASPIASEGRCFLAKKTKPKPASSGCLGIYSPRIAGGHESWQTGKFFQRKIFSIRCNKGGAKRVSSHWWNWRSSGYFFVARKI